MMTTHGKAWICLALATCALTGTPATLPGQPAGPQSELQLTPSTQLQPINARVSWVEYRGRRALHLAPRQGHEQDTDQEMMAVLVGSEFRNGVIEVDVAGSRRKGYATDDISAFKGFVGVSFRMRGDTSERFYIRPENARLDNQLFRNRSTQYEAGPQYTWQRLRQESPGVYESYVDLEAGAWTRLRIEVDGTRARLFVNDAVQPSLVVNDLKLGDSRGAIALWTRISSDAYFSNLRVRHASTDARKQLPSFSDVLNARAEHVTYRGVPAVRLLPDSVAIGSDTTMLALVKDINFQDGTIEVEVAGSPRVGAPPDARGFIGVSFRTGARGAWSEVFYLRPTNARADDQLRRNHSVQYASDPEFPWYRLRKESPGMFESYADVEAGVWTNMRIVVSGKSARLYVNGAAQPALVVTDLKRGVTRGQIALWAHVDTDAYFSRFSVTPR